MSAEEMSWEFDDDDEFERERKAIAESELRRRQAACVSTGYRDRVGDWSEADLQLGFNDAFAASSQKGKIDGREAALRACKAPEHYYPHRAIVVALLPPVRVYESACAANAVLAARQKEVKFAQTFRVGGAKPHVTLVQLYARTDDMASSVVRAVEASLARLALSEAQMIRMASVSDGPKFDERRHLASWDMSESSRARLVAIQAALIDALAPLIVANEQGHPRCFDGGDANEATMRWVARFRSDSAAHRYNPHITLGLCDADDLAEFRNRMADEQLASPCDFDARTSIVVGQLGNFCTLQTILHQFIVC
jgi:2'-5' RNA ligase